MVTHYVYRINDPVTREFYFGVRTCKGSPDDDSYMGSYKSWEPEDPNRLEKWILRDDFATREEANQYERDLLIIYIDDELNRNYNISGVKFCTQGVSRPPFSEEWKRNHSERMKGENNPMYECIRPEEWKINHSERMKGENNPMFGRNGENCPGAKLTWKEVHVIRRLYATCDYLQRELGDMFGVNQSVISDIINNKIWVE